MLAFILLCASSSATLALELSTSTAVAAVPFIELYLLPSFELLMVVSLLLALVWRSDEGRKLMAVVVTAIIILGVAATASYAIDSSSSGPPLPSGCERNLGGFLIIASSLGYNDSIAHGAPVKSWPVIDVTKGTQVNITLCNTYSQPVGFQVAHYLSDLESVPPGHVSAVSFLANETGSFEIYCSVFNPIHLYLQGGALNVF